LGEAVGEMIAVDFEFHAGVTRRVIEEANKV
jgi:hypothetical protein